MRCWAAYFSLRSLKKQMLCTGVPYSVSLR